MFGYVKPFKPELKIKDYMLFTSVYCGMCKDIKSVMGNIPRFTLNYDITFLAVLLHSLEDDDIKIKYEICPIHPLSRKPVAEKSDFMDYCSYMNMLLSYYNLIDKWNDEKNIKSLSASLMLKPGINKVISNYPEKHDKIRKLLMELSALEKSKVKSIDTYSNIFGDILKEIFIYPRFSDDIKLKLGNIGFFLGKWIYTIDSFDDIKRDLRSGSFNPLFVQYDYAGEDSVIFKKRIIEYVQFDLMMILNSLTQEYRRICIKSNKGIIDNIIYMGIPNMTKKILNDNSSHK